MSTIKPKFIDSEYFYADEEGWHLKDGAPSNIQKEFDEYMKYEEECEKRGIDL